MTKEEYINEIKLALLDRDQSYSKVEKAYKIASELHKDQKRKDGTPYIIHPLEVALILAKTGFEPDCVCGAILHDTVEDCGYSLDQMEKEFGKDVRDMVDAVSEVKKEDFKLSDELQELFIESKFEHTSIDEKTYNKLVKQGKSSPLAFYIKFADRIHNLRTLGTFSYLKQIEKVKQTEEQIIPLAKCLKSNYFYKELKNECFKIKYKDIYEDFWYIYHNNLECSKNNINNIIDKFKAYFYQNKSKIKIEYDLVKEYEVFEILKQTYSVKNFSNISGTQINIIPIYNIYVIDPRIIKRIYKKNGVKKEDNLQEDIEPNDGLSDIFIASQENNILTRFSFIFESYFAPFFKIIGAGVEDLTDSPYLIIKDNSRVLYKIFHMSPSEYMVRHIGTDQYLIDLDDENTHDIVTNYIEVKTKSNEIIKLPENSTALDFAFAIHDDLGMSFDYAEIYPADKNKKEKISNKIEKSYFEKLSNGDKVIIHCKTDDNGNIVPCPKLKWLAYVNSANAKNKLIKYFEKILDSKK